MANDERKIINGVPEERRRFPRLAASVDVNYSVVKKTSAAESSEAKNISAGGICLIVYQKLKIGTVLDLKIFISDINQTVTAQGKVIWSSHFTVGHDSRDRYDVGIEFIEIDQAARRKISEYVFKLK